MKRLILLQSLLLLVFLAGGAWLLFPERVADVLARIEASRNEPVFVKLSPITVPVIGTDRVAQFVTLELSVELTDSRGMSALTQNLPRLHDAYLITIYDGVQRRTLLDGPLLDLAKVKEQLTGASARILGPSVVRDVLVQVAVQRPL